MLQVSECQHKPLEFAKALKSFLGYLEGTHKASHTIKNYRLDILAFRDFLASEVPGQNLLHCEDLNQKDLERYHGYLKGQTFKINTRRRKLLTAQRFLRFLSQRNKLTTEAPLRMAAPHKVERIPYTVPQDELILAIRKLPAQTPMDHRNRALLWVMAETGCLVSEATGLKPEHWSQGAQPKTQSNENAVLRVGLSPASRLEIPGKAGRTLPVTAELFAEVMSLEVSPDAPLFPGHNKYGSLGAAISSRGVELLVRFYAQRLGFPRLTPRTFRHSAVLGWFEQGLKQDEIQARLGLKTPYAFRMYAPLFEQSLKKRGLFKSSN